MASGVATCRMPGTTEVKRVSMACLTRCAQMGITSIHTLENNGAGDEFRGNDEVLTRFFNPDGSLKPEMRTALQKNTAVLLNPSPQRV